MPPVTTADQAASGQFRAEMPDATFDALIFDWDGTAVADRCADAFEVRERIEALCAAGVHVFVVSGTHVGNVDGQLRARPRGRGRLHLCLNRGSEVFEVTGAGPSVMFRRTADASEEAALDRAAQAAATTLRARGLDVQVVSGRLNRRKIDIIPVPEWADPKKADIALLADAVALRLSSAGMTSIADVVAVAAGAAREAGLADPRITTDVKHVEIGLTDKSDSTRWAATWLAARGVTGALVLIGGGEFGPIGGVAGSDSLMMVDALARATVVSVGVEPGGVPGPVINAGGGPARFMELLDGQLARRHQRRVPQIDPDPAWIIDLPGGPAKERVAEALGALGNGWAGTRASREEDGRGVASLFVVSGVYTEDGDLLHGPTWTGLELTGGHRGQSERRLLDLRTATLMRSDPEGTGLLSIRFVSAASADALALRAEAPVSHLAPGLPLLEPDHAHGFERDDRGEVSVARTGSSAGEISVAARDVVTVAAGRRAVERLAAWVAPAAGGSGFDQAQRRLTGFDAQGFDALLAEHREQWAGRWADADVVIEGDPADQLAARFAVFHLLSAAAETGEAAVGARGLTGDAYGGHVFWDADVFVLPALAAIRPAAARAMLEYRIRRLPAARATAKERGLRGARFPWESARDGSDVTPRHVRGRHGEIVPILTGTHEEHIVADVAWAAVHYAAWTGDDAFLAGPGRDLVVDTARYWASRIRHDAAGRCHLYGVMGPDEYHEVVDDNTYTNVMARWNLRRGADLLSLTDDSGEADLWRTLADGLVDGWDPGRGLYEQFAGYFDLEPLLMSQVAPPPTAVDVLLGQKRVSGSQLIKQADVVMLHHLVSNEVVAGSLGPCLEFYEARTAHGSSLSPAISASLLARAKQPERALDLFRLAARLDLDDLTHTTASGLHLATMGGVWQALAYGFLGLHADPDGLAVDPCLPAAWSALGMRFRFRGHPVGVRAEPDRVLISCDAPLMVRVAGSPPLRCEPPGAALPLGQVTAKRSPR